LPVFRYVEDEVSKQEANSMKKKSTASKRTVAANRAVKRSAKSRGASKKSATKQQRKPAMLTKIKHVFVDSAMAFKALMSGDSAPSVDSEPKKSDQNR
jgi:hypothetical protein